MWLIKGLFIIYVADIVDKNGFISFCDKIRDKQKCEKEFLVGCNRFCIDLWF